MSSELPGVSQLDLVRWKNDSVTRAYFEKLKADVREAQTDWLSGAYQSADGHVDSQQNSAGLSAARTLHKQGLWFEDIKIEDEDATSNE